MNTIEDGSVVADGAISLREAITAANTNVAFLDAPAGEDGPGVVDTITFAPALNGMMITLGGSSLTISDELTISDSNTVPITISGAGNSGVFEIAAGAGTVTIEGVTVAGGLAVRGGGLFVNAGQTLNLNDVAVISNVATGDAATDGGGGLYNDGGTLTVTGGTISNNWAIGSSGSGGGIFSTAGNLTISNTIIAQNEANRAGGGIELIDGSALLTDVSIVSNDVDLDTANPGNGGGVHITGAADFTMDGGIVFGNLAGREGGGLWNGSGTMTIQNGTLIQANEAGGNEAHDGGGGIFNNGGTLIVDGSAAPVEIINNIAFGLLGSGGGIFNATGGTATINDAIITGNEAERAGGGIEDASGATGVVGLSLTNVTLNENIAFGTDTMAPGNGGGLHVSGAGDVTISGGEVNGNTAALEGGGLWNSIGVMTITDGATIDGNVAEGDGADDGGGGIFNNGGTLTIDGANGLVTISNNAATGTSGSGGGVFSTAGDVTISSSAIQFNEANRAGGGIELIEGSALLTDVNIINNDVDLLSANPGNGGGVHITGAADFTMDGGSVFGNLAGREGGGLWNSTGTMTIQNGTLIQANEAGGDEAHDGGGGIFNNGGTLIVDGSAAMVNISDNIAFGAAGSGGGIFSIGGSVTINDAVFDGNEAVRAGGGIEVAGGIMTLTDTDLTNNDVDDVVGLLEDASPGNGGGLHISGFADVTINGGEVSGNVAANEGGGLWNSNVGILTVTGTTIEDNTAPKGGGVFTQGGAPAAVRVTLTNLAPDDGPTNSGLFLTPAFTAFHDGTYDTFDSGVAASAGLERLAEDGNTGPITTAFMTAQPDGVTKTFPGALAPGATQQMVIGLNPVSSRYFSFASMVIPSNDAFIGNPDPLSNEIFDAGGAFTGALTFTVAGSQVWDAGTEENNEMNAAFFDQTAPDAGTVEGGTVALHPGFISSVGNPGGTAVILGGTQSVGPGRTFGTINADFTTASYNLLQVTIEEVASGTTITDAIINANTATGDAADEGGGGIFNDGGTLLVTGSTISNNTALGTSGSGGGIFSSNGDVTISSSVIRFNEANRAGGGIELIDGSALLTDVSIVSNDVDLDTANPGNGGGVHITGAADFTMDGGSVFGNLAGREGGGLWNGSGTMTIQNGTLIQGNEAGGDEAHDGGGGIFNNGGTLIVDGSVAPVEIINNIAFGLLGSGGGIFNATGGTATINDAIITGNEAERAGGGIEDASGAAGVIGLSLTNVTLNDNIAFGTDTTAPGNGGGLHVSGAGDVTISGGEVNGNTAALEGGGLWNSIGVMTITDGATINGNVAEGDGADDGGGGIFNNGGTLTIDGANGLVTISNNAATGASGSGGGVFSTAGDVTISSSAIQFNEANRAGGGIELIEGSALLTDVNIINNDVDLLTANPGNGGGVHITGAADFTMDGGSVFGNLAGREGGGLWNSTGTMTIQNGTLIQANEAGGDEAHDGGGGIFNNGGTLIVDGSAAMVNISDNIAFGAAGSGGGIFNNLSGTVTINGATLDGNEASRAGGGIEDNSNASITISNSTLSNNVTGASPGNGGALHISADSGVTVNNSTISGNSAAKEGGGLWNSATGTLTVTNSTVTGNSADVASSGGGIFTVSGGATVLNNTIVAGNDDTASGIDNDIAGATVTGNNNLIGDAASSGGLMNEVNGNIVGDGGFGVRPLASILNPVLADNGGLTLTHALAFNSPAIDAGDSSQIPVEITNDQRGVGFDRIIGGTVDIGAFEDQQLSDLLDVTFYNEDAAVEDGLSPNSTGQRSIIRHIQVILDGNIAIPTGAVTDGTFVLTNSESGGNVGLNVDSSVQSGGQTTVVLSFTSGADVNGLLDGNYQLQLNGGTTFDADGSGEVGGTSTIVFHRLFGDSDGDRDVDSADYSNVYQAFYGNTTLQNAFDRDNDGDLSDEISDFFANFGKRLSPI